MTFIETDSYVQRKIRHMTRMGIQAEMNPKTGAARPTWLTALSEADANRAKARENRKAMMSFVGDDETSFAAKMFPLYR